MRLRTIIIDDEKYSRENLRAELEFHTEVVEIIDEASSVESALKCIDLYKPDLVFLDINLGDGTGFDVLEQLAFKDFKLVFLTAYDQYAMKAMKFNAIDYLLKPLNKAELNDVIQKVIYQKFKAVRQIENLLLNQKSTKPKKIVIPSNDGLTICEITEIIRCQSDGNYTQIYFTNRAKILSSKTLKHYDELLQNLEFERVHNSHLVNINHIKKYINTDGGFLRMIDGSEIPISQRKKTQVLQTLENLQF